MRTPADQTRQQQLSDLRAQLSRHPGGRLLSLEPEVEAASTTLGRGASSRDSETTCGPVGQVPRADGPGGSAVATHHPDWLAECSDGELAEAG